MFRARKKKEILPPPPLPPRPEEPSLVPKPSESRSNSSTSVSTDGTLNGAKLAMYESSELAREIKDVDPYVRIEGEDWWFYRRKVTVAFIIDLFTLTKEDRLKLRKVRFVKCTFEEGAFKTFVQILSLESDRAPPISVVFDGYFHEHEKKAHPNAALPFGELCEALQRSRNMINRVSFQRCLLTDRKMLLLFQTAKRRNTVDKQHVELTMHFEMENLVDREYNVNSDLLNVVSDVPWDREEHDHVKDVACKEIVYENGTTYLCSLKEFNGSHFAHAQFQTTVRLAKMKLEVSFDYYSDKCLLFGHMSSLYTQSIFVEQVNSYLKELGKQKAEVSRLMN